LDDIWTLLGHVPVAEGVARVLHEEGGAALVSGPPGCGKSTLALALGGLWQESDGSVVVAQGDLLRDDVPRYPLAFAMASLASGWRTLGASLGEIAAAGESLVRTGGVITTTVRVAARMRTRRRKARMLLLAEPEQRILFELQRLAGKKPLLLFADNLHWWDDESLELLGRLREPAMMETFPFLDQMRLLAVETAEPFQHVSHPVPHDALVAGRGMERFQLRRPERAAFGAVLERLGAPRGLPEADVDALFDLTGGHLALAARCARGLGEGALPHARVLLSTRDFVRQVLTDRIRALGDMGERAIELLQISAVLGLRFRRDELVCAWPGDATESARLLRFLRDQDVLGLSDDTTWFVHDVFREHFLGVGPADLTEIRERIGECLRRLSPADYELRCQNAAQAEQTERAGTLGVQAGLARVREGQAWNSISASTLAAVRDAGFEPVLAQLEQAARSASSYQHVACLEALASLPRALPRELAAEADLLRASSYMSTRSRENAEVGRAILEAWDGLEVEEPELGIRLMRARLYDCALQADKAQARELEGAIQGSLRQRARLDASAEDELYTLDRIAGALYDPDIALLRVRAAADYFGPRSAGEVPRRPMEYYRSLINLCALLILNGRYEEATRIGRATLALADSFGPSTFPRLDYAHMNLLLSEVRSGATPPAEAVARQARIGAQDVPSDDPFFAWNALAVFHALAGDLPEAEATLQRASSLLELRERPEVALVYLLRSNALVIEYLQLGIAAIPHGWDDLEEVVNAIPYSTRRYLVRRHELLAARFSAATPPPAPAEFDRVLVADDPLRYGPFWDHIGRAFWLPEIEWWR
jgi:energy-coupling factor transporter ATP-binding protein EcfA2